MLTAKYKVLFRIREEKIMEDTRCSAPSDDGGKQFF